MNNTSIPVGGQQTLFEDDLQVIYDGTNAIKELKKLIREIEQDYPMELEDLILSLKDLQKQVKERKQEYMKRIMEEDDVYNEYREQLQVTQEDVAHAKLRLFKKVSEKASKKDIDETIVVCGTPLRVQTQKGTRIYVNGEELK